MRNVLLLGEKGDPLLAAMSAQLEKTGGSSQFLSEARLYEATEFSHILGIGQPALHLVSGSQRPELGSLTGVVQRLHRRWWPSATLDVQDQLFVYHETMAAWYSMLYAMPCTVLNRAELDFWLGDPTYLSRLVASLRVCLGLSPLDNADGHHPYGRCDDQTGRADDPTVFIVGDAVVAPDRVAEPVASELAARREKLGGWMRNHDLGYVGLSFRSTSLTSLVTVDPLPPFESTPPDVTQAVARHILEEFS